MASAASIKVLGALLLAATAQAKAPYCLPGNACFPSQSELQSFNASVHGALIKIEPYGSPCYTATYNAEECKQLAAKKEDGYYRQELPGKYYPGLHPNNMQ